MIRSRSVSLALTCLFVWVTACSSYKQIQVADVADHKKVRVTTTDGQRETIDHPRVESDSIKGKDSESLPLAEVSEVESARFAWLATALVIAAVAVPVGLITARVVECATNQHRDDC